MSAEAAGLTDEITATRVVVDETEKQIQPAQAEVNAAAPQKRNEIDGRLESRQSSIRMMTARHKAVSEESAQLRAAGRGGRGSSARGTRQAGRSCWRRMTGLKDERDGLDSQRSELMARRDTARNSLGTAREQAA